MRRDVEFLSISGAFAMNRLRCVVLVLLASPVCIWAQKEQKEEEFLKAKPAIGEAIPELTVYSPDGKELKTSSLRGQHVVLTFGCLT